MFPYYSVGGVGGNDIVDGTRAMDRSYNNYSTQILNRWHGEGTSNTIPRVAQPVVKKNRNYNNFSQICTSTTVHSCVCGA